MAKALCALDSNCGRWIKSSLLVEKGLNAMTLTCPLLCTFPYLFIYLFIIGILKLKLKFFFSFLGNRPNFEMSGMDTRSPK